jgi:hypothetical protein
MEQEPLIVELTQHAVRLALAEDDAEEARRSDLTAVHDDISPSVLINSGMDIEEQQYVSA